MPEASKKHHILLAFDFGMARIGIAVGQTISSSANPLAILKARDGVPDWNIIKDIIETWHADGLVVGLPINMDGNPQTITYAAKRFANKLNSRFRLPVYTIDERLTTVIAKQELCQQLKKSPKEIDSYAAKLILESWLRQYLNQQLND